MPDRIYRLTALSKQCQDHADNDGGENGEDSNRTILTVEEGHRAFKNGVSDFLHRRGARIFAQYISCEIGCENDREESYNNGDPNIVAHLENALLQAQEKVAGQQ